MWKKREDPFWQQQNSLREEMSIYPFRNQKSRLLKDCTSKIRGIDSKFIEQATLSLPALIFTVF